jgi:MFS family permease
MNRFGVQVPIVAGYALGLLSCLLTIVVPETLPASNNTESSIGNADAQSDSQSKNFLKFPWRARMASAAKSHVTSLGFVSKSPNLVALLAAVLIDSFNGSVPYFVVQYTSTKFAAPISEAGLLITIKAIITMVVYLTLVPVVGQRLLQDKWGLDARARDLWLARLTITCAPVGFFIIVIAPNFVVAGVGLIFTALATGCVNLIRSVATDMIEKDQVSQLYGLLNAIQTTGGLISGPLLAELFAAGLRLGGAWVALPFALCAALGVLSSSIVWLIRLPSHASDEAS